MFKIVSIGILVYILYRLVFPAKALRSAEKDNLTGNTQDEVIDIDYEELD
jgi:hypothetical protein